MSSNTISTLPSFDSTADEGKPVRISGGQLSISQPVTVPDWVTASTYTGINNTVADIAYINSTYIAYGSAGGISTSTDGITWTQGSLSAGTTITGVAYGAGVYVAIGSQSTFAVIFSSTDAITWTLRYTNTSSAAIGNLRGIIFAASVFSVVADASGNGSMCLSSSDGITWASSCINFGTVRNQALAFGASTFVSVGFGGIIFYSADGATWTQVDSKFGFGNLTGVLYANSLFVAYGTGSNYVVTSTDGITWTLRDHQLGNTSIGSTSLQTPGIVFGASTFVAIGANGNISTSTNGTSWTLRYTQPSVTVSTPAASAIRFVNSTFVAIGGSTGFALRTSTDGISWTERINPFSTSPIVDIAFGASVYVLVSNTAADGGTFYTTTDFVTFSARNSNFTSTQVKGIIFDSGTTLFVAYGGNTTNVVTSPDGTTWTTRAHGLAQIIGKIVVVNSTFIAIGNTAAGISTSTNGTAWTSRTSNAVKTLFDVAFGAATYVAVGGDTTTSVGVGVSSTDATTWTSRITQFSGASSQAGGLASSIFFLNSATFVALGGGGHISTSTDGITWTGRSVNDTHTFKHAAYGASIFVVTGLSGVLWSSPDAVTWTSRTSQFGSSNINHLLFANSLFVICGQANQISTSTDGTTWVARLCTLPSATTHLRLAFGASTWVLVNANTSGYNVITSTDAITWTVQAVRMVINNVQKGIAGMVFGGSLFVTVAGATDNMAQYSSDGLSWTDSRLPMGVTGYTAMSYGASTYVLVGVAGAAAYSTNMTDWTLTSIKCGCNTQNDLTFGASVFVTVGANGSLASSADGITWTARTSQFSNSNINSIVFGNSIFVAVGDYGLISSSTDGSIWTARTSGLPAYSSITKVRYVNSTFIGLTNSGHIVTSTNGTAWTVPTSPFVTLGLATNDVTFGAGVYVVTGGSGALASSADASTWTMRNTNVLGNLVYPVFGNGIFVVANASINSSVGPGVITSTDGITWKRATSKAINTTTATTDSMIFAGGMFVFAKTSPQVSVDGINWETRATSQIGSPATNFNIIYLNGSFFMISSGANSISRTVYPS